MTNDETTNDERGHGILRRSSFGFGHRFVILLSGFDISGTAFPGGRRFGRCRARSVPHAMHYLAPFPIIIGVVGAVAGVVWLVAAGSDEDGGPDSNLFFLFGAWYVAMRVLKALFSDPMSVLPAFGILLVSAALIWVGVVML